MPAISRRRPTTGWWPRWARCSPTPPARAGHRFHLRSGWNGVTYGPARATTSVPRAIPEAELLAFLTAEHPLRDKTLWWLLYESAARAGEVLALDIADLDLRRRRAVVIGKGGRAELIGWETKTARLLPRLLYRRREGPLFLTEIAPAPTRQPALADLPWNAMDAQENILACEAGISAIKPMMRKLVHRR
jgi:integrase